jgi:WD40 repeat protein
VRLDRESSRQSFPVAANSLTYSPDGRFLASGGHADDGSVRLWDSRTGKPLGRPVRASRNVVGGLAFNAAGNLLASVGYGDIVSLWVVDRGGSDSARLVPARPNRLHGHSGAVTAAAFSPDSRLLATGDRQGVIRLWDAKTGRGVGEALTAANALIYDLEFHPDSTLLASADDGGAVRFWDVAEARELGRPLRAHVGAVMSLSFRADGNQLASVDHNNAVLIWDSVIWSAEWSDVARRLCPIVSRNLTPAEWEQFLPGQDYRVTCEQWPSGD